VEEPAPVLHHPDVARADGHLAGARRVARGPVQHLPDGPARIAHQVADRVESAGSWMRDSDADRILGDIEDFARSKPWAVAGGALVLGFTASRLLKASSSQRYEHRSTAGALPPAGRSTASLTPPMGVPPTRTAPPVDQPLATPPAATPAGRDPLGARVDDPLEPGGRDPLTPRTDDPLTPRADDPLTPRADDPLAPGGRDPRTSPGGGL